MSSEQRKEKAAEESEVARRKSNKVIQNAFELVREMHLECFFSAFVDC